MPGNRRSIRLKGYDYAQQGAYFVTTCVNNRECLFGDVFDEEIILNECGRMVDKWWRELMRKYDTVELDEYVVMPNHFHGIILVVQKNENGNVGADLRVRPKNKNNPHNGNNFNNGHGNNYVVNGGNIEVKGQTHRSAPTLVPTVGTIVQWFKTMSTNQYIQSVKSNNWLPFNKRLWQRNYYEHIIRNETELNRIRQYIVTNPANWKQDQYYSE